MAQLTGAELLAALKQLGPAPKAEMLRATGYVGVNSKTGAERLNYSAFHEALLEANGVQLNIVRASTGGGRNLSYFTRQQKKGMIVIGPGYTEQLDFEAGQLFKIELDAEAGTILLTAAAEEEEEEEEEEEAA